MNSVFFLLCSALLAFFFASTGVDAGTDAAGLKYLAAKKKEDGVVETKSGLLYKEIRAGNADGKTPTVDSPCQCHYSGMLIDGTEFDSSYKRGEPLIFAPNQVIKGPYLLLVLTSCDCSSPAADFAFPSTVCLSATRRHQT